MRSRGITNSPRLRPDHHSPLEMIQSAARSTLQGYAEAARLASSGGKPAAASCVQTEASPPRSLVAAAAAARWRRRRSWWARWVGGARRRRWQRRQRKPTGCLGRVAARGEKDELERRSERTELGEARRGGVWLAHLEIAGGRDSPTIHRAG
eukprot:scaffold53387_cov72-Phaeocystis_antarctica.AAC.1